MPSQKQLVTKYNTLATRYGLDTIDGWKGSKADLQTQIDALLAEHQEPETLTSEDVGDAAEVVSNEPAMITVADLAREHGVSPKVARARLRRTGRRAVDGRHPRVARGSNAYDEVLAIILPKPAPKADDSTEASGAE